MQLRWICGTAVTVGLALVAGCGGDPQGPGGDDGGVQPEVTSLTFLAGSWEITSRYVAANGVVEETEAVSRIESSIGGRVLKETLQGTRGGRAFEIQTLFAQRTSGAWVVARADGEALTFDVLEGVLTAAAASASFTTRSGTRTDDGRERIRLADVTQDSFTWVAERSENLGGTWTEYWTMSFRRASAVTLDSSTSACGSPEYHEFDFWLGDWRAVGPSGTGGGTNDIRSRLDGCILEENWVGGSTGTSFNMRDSRTGLWYQVWGDSFNYVLVATGGIVGDQMILEGDGGGAQRVRITWTPLSGGRVRQLGEVSNGGSGWQVSYDLTYTLK